MPTVRMPSSLHARKMRIAISPRFAHSTLRRGTMAAMRGMVAHAAKNRARNFGHRRRRARSPHVAAAPGGGSLVLPPAPERHPPRASRAILNRLPLSLAQALEGAGALARLDQRSELR